MIYSTSEANKVPTSRWCHVTILTNICITTNKNFQDKKAAQTIGTGLNFEAHRGPTTQVKMCGSTKVTPSLLWPPSDLPPCSMMQPPPPIYGMGSHQPPLGLTHVNMCYRVTKMWKWNLSSFTLGSRTAGSVRETSEELQYLWGCCYPMALSSSGQWTGNTAGIIP